nr:MAG: ORF1 [TTV-like mini virus]
MPANWRRFRWRRRRPRRFRFRRFANTFRPRWRFPRRRRLRVRRRRRYYKYRHKARKITLKQFQPTHIRTCKVKGFKCLFQGGSNRLSHNYIQYIQSKVPEHWHGGGGWGLMVLSLGALFEDWEHLRNVFTVSNVGLPLTRYMGGSLTFYQSQYTDYVVTVDTCWPMVDTELTHANSAPSRMLLARHKHIIPSRQTRHIPKSKIKVRIKPPSQMQSKWYFSKDICNTPLVLITATSCSLPHYYLSPRATSNNATILCLNTDIFKRCDFQHPSVTEGYKPKDGMYLYSGDDTTAINSKPTSKDHLIYLGNTKDAQRGTAGDMETLAKWGNPFYEKYLNGELPLYYSSKPPSHMKTQYNQSLLTPLETPLLIKCRYNPENDTGEDNKAYIVDNYRRDNWDETGDRNRDIEGFPLFILFWGWTDWLRKLGEIPRLDDDHIVVFKTKQLDVKLPYYIPLSYSFQDGHSPYETPITTYDYQNWYPKIKFQEEMLANLTDCGPGVARPPSGNSVQAKMLYNLKFKWGGCPKTLPDIKNPCLQPKWPTADTVPSGIEIENPAQDPKTYLYSWDWRRDQLTEPAAKRLKTTEETDDLLFYPTGQSRSNVPPRQAHQKTPTSTETSDSEEEEKTPGHQLRVLHKQQRLLKYRILQLASKLKNIE